MVFFRREVTSFEVLLELSRKEKVRVKVTLFEVIRDKRKVRIKERVEEWDLMTSSKI